jgi:hypothetical protein
MSELPLRIGADLLGAAVGCGPEIITFLSPKAFPPGQPLELTLFPDAENALDLKARSIGSKLQADQRFEVRARLINLSRAARQQLNAAFGGDGD